MTAIDRKLAAALAALKRLASKKVKDGMKRYAIPSDKAFGVSMGNIQKLGKRLGRDHTLAEALWASGHYEARMLAAYVAEPERVSPAQMERWCKDFDNWAICDTLCFVLFDRSPHAWRKLGFELGLGIGIAQGHATMGLVGFEGRFDYGAVGAVCNLSARLCAEAKAGQTLVHQRVAGKLDGLVRGEPVGPLELKGFPRPVPALLVTAVT